MSFDESRQTSPGRSDLSGKSWTGVVHLDRKTRRHWHYAMIIVLATTLNVARLMQAEPLSSANDRSRWCTVWSLVERGTYQIDEIRQRPGWDTIDLVRHEEHFYSTKPPLFPTTVAGLSWVLKHTLGWSLDRHLLTTTRLLLMFVNVLPMTLALWLLARLIDRFATTDFTRYLLVLSATTATLLQPFVIVLNNHTPGAVSCVIALYAAVQILIEERRGAWWFACAGFFAAWTCCVELPAAALGASMFVLLARADLRRTLIWFVPAALVPLAAFFVTNYLVTGGWKPFYLHYGTDKYLFIDDGVPSYWMSPRGIDQSQDSLWVYFLHCTVGHHGIFSLTPLYLITLWGWVRYRFWKTSPLRLIHLWGLMLTLVVFGFFLTKTENYNYGGVSVALRWLLWLTPFWLLAMIPALDGWQPAWKGRTLCLLLFAVSVFSAWFPFSSPWQQPWLFQWMDRVGWIDYSDPAPEDVPPFHTWLQQLPSPDVNEPQSDYWIEFESVDASGRVKRLRIEDAGGRSVAGRDVRFIAVTGANASSQESEAHDDRWLLPLDVQALTQGRDVEEVVVWSEVPTLLNRNDIITFVRGLPEPRAYQPGRMRYIDSPLRIEKFQCQHAASRVLFEPDGSDRQAIYRRDLWSSDDVPFGVLMFETTITDADTGAVISRQRMTATRAGQVRRFDEQRLIK